MFANKLVSYLLIIISITTCSIAQERDALYQVSTINALLGGVYAGSESFAQADNLIESDGRKWRKLAQP